MISADSPGLRDSVKPGLSGELYKYGDIADLSEKIVSVIAKQDKFSKYCEGAVQWAKQFSWDISARKMLDILENVVETERSN